MSCASGARTLRIVETARGGILRRGIAVSQAHVAVVTNVSADHFGEYGIDDLAGLADVKLTVAGVRAARRGCWCSTPTMRSSRRRRGASRAALRPLPAARLVCARRRSCRVCGSTAHAGGATCGVRRGRLHAASRRASSTTSARVAAMPLSVEGSATYNIANLAGAALAAAAPRHAAARSSPAVFARFGAHARRQSRAHDALRARRRAHPRRLRAQPGGAAAACLRVAEHLRARRRTPGHCLLGHAGNRQEREIEALARCAAQFRPALDRRQGERGAPARPRAGRDPAHHPRGAACAPDCPTAALPQCA